MSTLLHHNNPEIQSTHCESGPQSGLSYLIRSKADAMLVYQEACWFASCDQVDEQYGLLEYLIEQWDSPSFSESDVRMVERIVNNLSGIELSDHEMEYSAPHFGFAKGLLEALAQAARQRVTNDQKQLGQEKALTPAKI